MSTYLLQETASALLQETGSHILLELTDTATTERRRVRIPQPEPAWRDDEEAIIVLET